MNLSALFHWRQQILWRVIICDGVGAARVNGVGRGDETGMLVSDNSNAVVSAKLPVVALAGSPVRFPFRSMVNVIKPIPRWVESARSSAMVC